MGWLLPELLLFILSIYINCYYFLVLTEKDADMASVSKLGAALLRCLPSSSHRAQGHLVMTLVEWAQLQARICLATASAGQLSF